MEIATRGDEPKSPFLDEETVIAGMYLPGHSERRELRRLAGLLTDPDRRGEAADALVGIGAPAVSLLVFRLDHTDSEEIERTTAGLRALPIAAAPQDDDSQALPRPAGAPNCLGADLPLSAPGPEP